MSPPTLQQQQEPAFYSPHQPFSHQQQQQRQQQQQLPSLSMLPPQAAAHVDGARWQPRATRLESLHPERSPLGAEGVTPFDDHAHLALRGDARVAELRVWADNQLVHGLQMLYVAPGAGAPGGAGAGSKLLEGLLAGQRRGRCYVLPLPAPGDAIVAVAGRFGAATGALEVLVVGTSKGRSGEQHNFGSTGEGAEGAPTGREFVLDIPPRSRVVGFHGAFAPTGHICALGAYTAPV